MRFRLFQPSIENVYTGRRLNAAHGKAVPERAARQPLAYEQIRPHLHFCIRQTCKLSEISLHKSLQPIFPRAIAVFRTSLIGKALSHIVDLSQHFPRPGR